MDHLLEVIASIDPRFIIGWAAIWFGIGAIMCALAWMAEKKLEARRLNAFVADLFSGETGYGHVIDIHGHGPKKDNMIHAHCICGESSLVYKRDDPSAPGLLEQWSDEHINSQMESAGR